MSVQSGWSRFTWGQAYWNEDALLATGWGAKAWNDGEYGNLADETVSLTGVSITSNIGAVGILANALVVPTGVSSTASTGSISPVIPKTVEIGGVLFQSTLGSITNIINVTVTPSGVSSTFNWSNRSFRSICRFDKSGYNFSSRNGSSTKRRCVCNRTSNNFITRNSLRYNFK